MATLESCGIHLTSDTVVIITFSSTPNRYQLRNLQNFIDFKWIESKISNIWIGYACFDVEQTFHFIKKLNENESKNEIQLNSSVEFSPYQSEFEFKVKKGSIYVTPLYFADSNFEIPNFIKYAIILSSIIRSDKPNFLCSNQANIDKANDWIGRYQDTVKIPIFDITDTKESFMCAHFLKLIILISSIKMESEKYKCYQIKFLKTLFSKLKSYGNITFIIDELTKTPRSILVELFENIVFPLIMDHLPEIKRENTPPIGFQIQKAINACNFHFKPDYFLNYLQIEKFPLIIKLLIINYTVNICNYDYITLTNGFYNKKLSYNDEELITFEVINEKAIDLFTKVLFAINSNKNKEILKLLIYFSKCYNKIDWLDVAMQQWLNSTLSLENYINAWEEMINAFKEKEKSNKIWIKLLGREHMLVQLNIMIDKKYQKQFDKFFKLLIPVLTSNISEAIILFYSVFKEKIAQNKLCAFNSIFVQSLSTIKFEMDNYVKLLIYFENNIQYLHKLKNIESK